MARIIYGVAGEGFGHSSRSHLIGQYLIDAGHEVLFLLYPSGLLPEDRARIDRDDAGVVWLA